ncbi:phosphate-binding protein, partial [Neobacillus drentensis]
YQHSYTKGEATDLAKAFLDYMMSDDIQNTLLQEQGYLPVTKMQVERDAQGTQKNL